MSPPKESARAEAKGANQTKHSDSIRQSCVEDTGWLSIGRGYAVRFSGVPGLALVSADWRPRVPRRLPRLVASRRYKAALAAFIAHLLSGVPK